MDTTFTNFALAAARRSENFSSNTFTKLCTIGVSEGIFGVNAHAVATALVCRMMPTQRIFGGDLLISSRMMPMEDVVQVFRYIESLEVTLEEMAIMMDDDGLLNFGLSFDGLKRIANHCEPVKNMLDHADCVLRAYELYTANK